MPAITFRHVPGYSDDLAHIHDEGFSTLAELAATRILELLGDRGTSPGLVVELGCGPGRTARALTDAGFDVLGLDASSAMIALAQRAAPAADFSLASFVEAELPPCRAVIAVGEVLGYVLDPPADTEGALAEVFARVHHALATGRLLVFDLAGPGRVPGSGPLRSWFEGRDWAVLVEAEEDRVAFRARVRRGYGNEPFAPGHRVYVARKA